MDWADAQTSMSDQAREHLDVLAQCAHVLQVARPTSLAMLYAASHAAARAQGSTDEEGEMFDAQMAIRRCSEAAVNWLPRVQACVESAKASRAPIPDENFLAQVDVSALREQMEADKARENKYVAQETALKATLAKARYSKENSHDAILARGRTIKDHAHVVEHLKLKAAVYDGLPTDLQAAHAEHARLQRELAAAREELERVLEAVG